MAELLQELTLLMFSKLVLEDFVCVVCVFSFLSCFGCEFGGYL